MQKTTDRDQTPFGPFTHASLAASTGSAAIVAALGLAHLLEVPGKHKLDASTFLAVQHHLYGGFAVVGGIAEGVALATLSTAAVRLAGRDPDAARAAGVGAAAAVAMLGLFAFGLRPLNSDFARWTAATIPVDWRTERNRWELLHAGNLGLALVTVGASNRARRLHRPRVSTRSMS